MSSFVIQIPYKPQCCKTGSSPYSGVTWATPRDLRDAEPDYCKGLEIKDLADGCWTIDCSADAPGYDKVYYCPYCGKKLLNFTQWKEVWWLRWPLLIFQVFSGEYRSDKPGGVSQ